MQTAGYWLDYCTSAMQRAGVFFGHGTDNARDEAAWMVLHVLGEPLDGRFDDWQQILDEDGAGQLQEMLRRRIEERIPLAYLVGEARFCGLGFSVTPDVLVPRSPLAELITERFSPWLSFAPGDRVLDMCTGGGCIAIAIAHHLAETRVDAVDISAAALKVAAENAARHRVLDRVELIESDLFDGLGERRYELIVSNPPYVSRALYEQLPPEYMAEPGKGLVSGEDGLDIVLKILDASPGYLASGGILVVEVGESAPALAKLLPRVPFLWLEFQHGGDGVFLLEYDQLHACRPDVRAVLEQRDNV